MFPGHPGSGRIVRVGEEDESRRRRHRRSHGPKVGTPGSRRHGESLPPLAITASEYTNARCDDRPALVTARCAR
jgi:hypothetical protein